MNVFMAFGGLERIRTAVGAFAELSLATRPRDLIIYATKLQNRSGIAIIKKSGPKIWGHLRII